MNKYAILTDFLESFSKNDPNYAESRLLLAKIAEHDVDGDYGEAELSDDNNLDGGTNQVNEEGKLIEKAFVRQAVKSDIKKMTEKQKQKKVLMFEKLKKKFNTEKSDNNSKKQTYMQALRDSYQKK